MTLTEAAAHINGAVIIHEPGTWRTYTGEIAKVDPTRRLVGVRVHYRKVPWRFRPGLQWWAPCHMQIPDWWHRKQQQAAERKADQP